MKPVASLVLAEFLPQHILPARALWEKSEGVGLSEADEPQALVAFLERNPRLSLVALQGSAIVGTVLCGHDGRRGLIHHLVVAESHRCRGIGRRLLAGGLAGLRSAGIQKAHLLVFKSNAGGLAFWRSVGAEERTAIALFSVATQNAG